MSDQERARQAARRYLAEYAADNPAGYDDYENHEPALIARALLAPQADPKLAKVVKLARKVAADCLSDADNIGHSKRSVYPCGTLLDAAKALKKCATLLAADERAAPAPAKPPK